MKVMIIAFSLLLFLAFLFSADIYGQSTGQAAGKKQGSNDNALLKQNLTPVYSGSQDGILCYLEAAYPKVTTRFSELFPGANNQLWIKERKSLFVYFLINQTKISAVFTERGGFKYSVYRLTASDLPHAVPDKIKTRYPSHKVFSVKLIKAPDLKTYEIVLENSSEFITIQIHDEEIMEIQKLRKTNTGSNK